MISLISHATRLLNALGPLLKWAGRLGFGRHAALAAARAAFPVRAQTPLRRAGCLMAGSTLIGTSVALLKQADLGMAPTDVLVSGLSPVLGLSLGQTVWVVAGSFFAVAAIFRQFPDRWGIAYSFANGVAIDAVSGLINEPSSLAGRLSFVIVALIFVSAGVSLVVHSGSTGGAFELLMKAGEERGKSRKAIRTLLEVSVLAIGFALGGKAGVATLAIAVAIGPMLSLIGRALQDHSYGRTLRKLQEPPQARTPAVTNYH